MCSWRGRFPKPIRCVSSASVISSVTRDLIAALHKIRDSYNVNGLGQVAAVATLNDLPYYRANFKKIIATREWLGRELTKLGFRVFPSQTNFILVQPLCFAAHEWQHKLRARKILVRWFNLPEVKDHLRITIGTPAEADGPGSGGAANPAVSALLRGKSVSLADRHGFC